MQLTNTQDLTSEVLAAVLSDDSYWPAPPEALKTVGLPGTFVESLICKLLLVIGTASGRNIAEQMCLPFGILENALGSLRTRQLLVHSGSAPFNDYYFSLTDQGMRYARAERASCAYVGPAPVPIMDYVMSVDAQTIGVEAVSAAELKDAFHDICVDPELIDVLGPAVNSSAGMFLFGAPGNGKSTLARRITACFGQEVWIPHAIYDSGQVIKLFDAAYHRPVKAKNSGIIKVRDHDHRWLKIKRPTVVVGGELTMDSLDLRHDATLNVCEAPLQMKSNCGCLLIDDFGRQQVAPRELLNRWIVPLENRHDFLTLPTGKKLQVPFEQLIIFSTNLEPKDLVDEAFLRRIPYKIKIGDPTAEEFHRLFRLYADKTGCEYRREVTDYLIETHYRSCHRAMRRCHPRDLLKQIKNYCTFKRLPMEMRAEYVDRVVGSYFAAVFGDES